MATKRTAEVTLRISWDAEEHDHPGQWDYAELLDLPDREHVSVERVVEDGIVLMEEGRAL